MADDHDTLDSEERGWLKDVRRARTLAELQQLTGAESEHDAYIDAKPRWKELRRARLDAPRPASRIPGDRVVVNGCPIHVHGITHADTDAERGFLRENVSELVGEGRQIYCEQGIRPMYFENIPAVSEIDDYRWAMHHCRERDISSHIDGLIEESFQKQTGMAGTVFDAATEFRDVAFSLIESGSDLYGDTFASALGDVASTFFMDHEQLATAENFESFELSRAAATDPSQLAALQQHYELVFLPQPIEREWLRRHDPELELFTHARNERIVSYALYHAQEDTPVHLIVGAAHQPGVAYYLSAYENGNWDYGEFELIP